MTTDQRGVPRPQGTAPDIGAFESRGFTLAIAQGGGQTTPAGSTFAAPLVVQVASPFGEPVSGGRVSFAAPTAGASAVVNPTSVTVGADGRASVDAVANSIAGSYAVTAQATGASSVAIALTNVAPPIVVLPPTVLAVQRFGDFAFPTTLAVTFSTPLDPSRAQNLSNYHLVELSGPGRPGRTIRLRSCGVRSVIGCRAVEAGRAAAGVWLVRADGQRHGAGWRDECLGYAARWPWQWQTRQQLRAEVWSECGGWPVVRVQPAPLSLGGPWRDRRASPPAPTVPTLVRVRG